MAMVNEKLLRLLLVLVGIAALGALGWRVYDFFTHQDQFYVSTDIRRLQDAAGGAPRSDPGHLLPFEEYSVIEKLNVTGKEPPKPEVSKPPPPPPTRLSERDLQLIYVQYVAPEDPGNAAYLQPADEQPTEDHIPGNLYSPGQKIRLPSKKGLDVRLLEVREESVVVGFGAGDDAGSLVLEMATHDLPQSTVQGMTGGAGGDAAAVVRASPKETRLNAAGEYEVGTEDAAYFEKLSQEQLLAAVPVRPERDRFSNEIRGLRIQSVPPDSPFSRLGLRADDIVLEVNGTPAVSRDELLDAMRRSTARSVTVRFERLGGVQTRTYRLP